MAFGKWAYQGLDLVLCFGDSPVWDCRAKGYFTVEGGRMSNEQLTISNFIKGMITGAVVVLFVFGVIFTLMYFNKRNKGLTDYAEKQIEIENLRENVINRDPDEFLDDLPDVRRAADEAAAEFERKRDEALQRFKSKLSSRAGFTD
jgi:hypothetical protein